MAARRVEVQRVPRDESAARWRKAVERLESMNLLMEAGSLDAALVEAIHASIAAADAFTIHHLGKQCASERHEDAARLVERVTTVQGSAEAARHLARLLDKKGTIEYSGRYPRPDEAEGFCEHARRFVEFVRKNLK